ncbi:MAG: tetratricopeptide repeat protein [Anaerolineales bacterium]|nr:tetratricopeptide repeat protein [Anaerolineales bacterium]
MRKFKGKEQLQAVYAVVGELTPSTAHLAALAAIPIIGRDAEMAQLRTAMQQTLAGQSTLIRLVGEAGAGKSQMTSHFCAEAVNAGFRILYTTCQSTHQHAAYAALRPLVRSLLHYIDGAQTSSNEQVAQLTAVVEATNPAWLLRLPLLGDLLDLPIPENRTTAAFDAALRQEALTSLIIEIVQQAAGDQPLVLVIEDVHWLDEASQRIVLALAHSAPSSRLLLLLAHRPVHGEQPGFFRELAGLAHIETITLFELDASGTRQLVRNRLQGEVGALALEVIYALGHGNPFLNEELVDALREGNRLVHEQGVWQLAPAIIEELRRANCLMRVEETWRLRPEVPRTAVDLGLPTSLHGLVLARLDRLPESTKLTLKVASVIGRSFELTILAAAHPRNLTPAALTEHLALAESRDFTRLETADSHLIYLFRHNITQEAVYQTLLEAQRQELHLYVAEAIEREAPGAIDQLAYHYTQCDTALPAVRGKALTYLDAAAKRAKRDHANETALAYFDRALRFEHRWDWLLGRTEALHVLGRRMQEEANLWVLYHFDGASPAQQLETALHFADFYEATGNYDSAVAWTGRARKIALEYEDQRGEAGCFIKTGVIAWRQGDYAAATSAYQSALAIARNDASLMDVEADAHYGLGLVLRQQSQFDEAQTQFDVNLSINRTLGNRYHEARALNALGALLSMQRRYAAAVELFQAALTIRESIGDRAGLAISLLSTAQAFASIGDYGKAEPILCRVIEIQRATNNAWDEMLTLNEFGILYMTVGAYESALTYLSTALERSQLINSDIGAAYILCNLGQVQRDCGRLDLAQETFRQGLELADAQQDENLAAIYHSDWAITAMRTGDYVAACQHGELALKIFQELKQPLSTPVVLATLAAAYLAQGNTTTATARVQAAINLLDSSRGEAVDFPERDYWQCSQVLAQLGLQQEAEQARRRAHELLMERAALISDAAMRESFLTKVPVHAEILAAGYRSSKGMNSPGVPSASTA